MRALVLTAIVFCLPSQPCAAELSWAQIPTATGYRVDVRTTNGAWKALPVSYVCADGTCTAEIVPPKGLRLYRFTALRGNEVSVREDAGIWLKR